MVINNVKRIKRPETLFDMAYETIKGLIITGKLDFGQIFSANQFAESLGVSRTPVRDALLQLSSEGLLTAVQGKGFKLKEFSIKEAHNYFETRMIIETYVVERLAENINDQDLESIANSINAMKMFAKEGDLYSFLEEDKAFHLIIVHRYDNELLSQVIEKIRDFISIFGQKTLSVENRMQSVIREHENIYAALKLGDREKSVTALRIHLESSENNLLNTI